MFVETETVSKQQKRGVVDEKSKEKVCRQGRESVLLLQGWAHVSSL